MKNRILLVLFQEYTKAVEEYIDVLNTLSQVVFEKVSDKKTEDADCKSIQTITSHVLYSGYIYANYLNSVRGIEWYRYNETIDTPNKGVLELRKMLAFTEEIFNSFSEKSNDEIAQWKYEVSWGASYDFEQLIEHAIVHVLRHRRQVYNFSKNKE